MPIFQAGSASVSIVPDFKNAQKSIGEWFASQGDLHVGVKPDLNKADLLKTKAELDALGGTASIRVDHKGLSSDLAAAMTDAFKGATGLFDFGSALTRVIGPAVKIALGGLGTELAAALAPAITGSLALLPAALLGLAAPLAAVAVGVHGVGDAFKALGSGNLQQIQAAMDKLAPSARDFVTQIHALGPAWSALRLDVQQNLFNGLGTAVSNLAHVALPVLKTGLSDIATSLNAGLVLTMKQLVNDGPQFAAIFQNINLSLGEFATNGLPKLAQTFVTLASVGSQFLPQIAKLLDGVIGRFSDWVNRMNASGQLAAIMQSAISTLQQLFAIVGNLVGVVGNIFKAALPFGLTLLTMLQQLTGGLKTFLGTDTAQSSLKLFFGQITNAVAIILPALQSLAQVIFTAILPAVGSFVQALAPLAATLGGALVSALSQIAVLVPPLAQTVAGLIGAFSPLIPVISQIVLTLLPPLLQVGHELIPVISALTQAFGTALLAAVKAVAPFIQPLAEAFIQILNAVTPALPVLGRLAANVLPPLLSAVKGLVDILVPILVPVLKLLADHADLVVSALVAWYAAQKILDAVAAFQAVGGIAGIVIRLGEWASKVGLISAATKVWAAAQWLINAAMDGNPIILIIAAIVALGVGIFELIKHWSAVKEAFVTAWNAVKNAFIVGWDAIKGAFQAAYDHVIKPVFDAIAAAAEFWWNHVLHPIFTAYVDAWKAIGAAVAWAWDNILHPIWDLIAGAAIVLYRIVVVVVLGAIEGAWWLMVHAAELAWNTVLKPVWEAIKAAALFMWNSVLKPTWDAIVVAWHALGTAVKWVYDNVIQPTWDAIKAAFSVLWAFLQVVWGGLVAAWHALGTAVKWVNDNVIQPVWDAIKAAVSFLWDNILKPIWGAIQTAWHDLGTALSAINDHVFQPIWDAIKNAVSSVQKAFEAVVAGIKTAWTTLEDVVATPINFVIKEVFDNGLFKAWNWVVDHLGLPSGWHAPEWQQLSQGHQFADGGFTGPGIFGTGGRLDPAGVVHANEFVINAKQTAKNMPLLHAINSGAPGFDGGGFVSPSQGVLAALANPFNPAGAADSILQMLKDNGDASQVGQWAAASDLLSFAEKIPLKIVDLLWSAAKTAIVDGIGATQTANSSFGNINLGGVVSSGPIVDIVKSAAAAYGWNTGDEWAALTEIINHESGFRNTAQNPSSSAYGIFQFLDSTWATVGGYKTSDPGLQSIFGMRYIDERYHDPLGAEAHEMHYGWFDQGGYLPPGWSTVYNGTGQHEVVLNPQQQSAIGQRLNGGGFNIGGISVAMQTANPYEVADELVYRLRVASRGGVYSTVRG